MYNPVIGRWISRDPLGINGEPEIVYTHDYVADRMQAVLAPYDNVYQYASREAELGRFSSRDPIEYEGSEWNLYEYVGGRVTGTVDPSGLSWLSEACCQGCARAYGASTLLEIQLGKIDGSDDRRGGNAFRHCLATCGAARACGKTCAKKVWDGRETAGILADDQDLANNAVGYAGEDRGGDCWDYCMLQWNVGRLTCTQWINGKRTLVPCPPRVPPRPPVRPPGVPPYVIV